MSRTLPQGAADSPRCPPYFRSTPTSLAPVGRPIGYLCGEPREQRASDGQANALPSPCSTMARDFRQSAEDYARATSRSSQRGVRPNKNSHPAICIGGYFFIIIFSYSSKNFALPCLRRILPFSRYLIKYIVLFCSCSTGITYSVTPVKVGQLYTNFPCVL